MGRTTQKGHKQPSGATSLEALKTEVKEGKRVPFYLLHGDEEFDRDEMCDWLITAVQPNAAMEFNIDVFHGDDLDFERLLECYYSYPVLATHRLVVLRKAERVPVEQCKKLDAIVDDLQESTIFVVVGGKIDLRRRLFKNMDKMGRRIDFKKPYQNQVSGWLTRQARKMGVRIEPEAIDLIGFYIGNNTRQLITELEKISTYVVSGEPITAKDDDEMSGGFNATNVFELADKVGQQNYVAAQKILHAMLENGEEPRRILPMLTRHLELLSKVLNFKGQRLSSVEMANKLGVSPYFLKNYREQARKFKGEQIWNGLGILLDPDRLLKSRNRSQHGNILRFSLMELCHL